MREVRYPKLWDRNFLEFEYTECGKTLAKIANEVGCDPEMVRHAMVMLGIPRRPRGIAKGATQPKLRGRKLSPEHRDKIGKAHLGKKRPQETGIRISEAQKKRFLSSDAREWMRQAMITAKTPEKLLDADWLRDQYCELGRTSTDLAAELDCDNKTVLNWLRRHGITVRKSGSWQRKRQGPLSNNWRGGISFEPYDARFNKDLKRQIFERDEGTCQLCFSDIMESGHCIHHMDYDKQNSEPTNLILLCRGCNSKVNASRIFWEAHFSKLLRFQDKI